MALHLNFSQFTQRGALDAAGGATDPYWSSVVLLAANDNAADGTTTFLDQSNSAHTLTGNGNAQYDTAQAPTGMTSSILLDGTGDFLTALDSTDWTWGTGDWTIETSVRFNDITNYGFLIGQTVQPNDNSWNVVFGKTADKSLLYQYSSTGSNFLNFTKAWASIATNTWFHVAVVRSGNSGYMFIDGTQIGTTASITASIFDTAVGLRIGSYSGGGQDVNGWIANLRVTKGVARYTADFTPPTFPLPTS